MVKRHSRERRDSKAPSKILKSNKAVPDQSTRPVKNFLLQFRRDKRSRSSQNSGRLGQRSSGTSDKRQSGTSDKNQPCVSASGKRVHSGTSPRRPQKKRRKISTNCNAIELILDAYKIDVDSRKTIVKEGRDWLKQLSKI